VLMTTAGVVISTVVVGGSLWLILHAFGIKAQLIRTLLFGALISPTDPIAVTGILRNVNAPKSLQVQMSGESLFNDGVGVVVFMALKRAETTGAGLAVGHLFKMFAIEAFGGLILGAIAGYAVYQMLRRIDDYQVEIMLTLALAMGAYAAAEQLPVSGPITVVTAGLVIGNQGRSYAMSDRTKERLGSFWEVIDSILNAVLFVLLGLEALTIPFNPLLIAAAAIAIPITVGARLVSVAIVQQVLKWTEPISRNSVAILTWGDLRGGISVALALSVPPNAGRNLTVTMTYAVVVFAILVQGLTIGPLSRWLLGSGEAGRHNPVEAAP
jgi:CPA1 family monovalent cation:H+ antiporter